MKTAGANELTNLEASVYNAPVEMEARQMGKIAARYNGAKEAFVTPKWKPRFQKAIKAAEALTLNQRESLVDVLKKRNVDAHRLELEAEIQESLTEYSQGKAKRGTLDDLLEDLDS